MSTFVSEFLVLIGTFTRYKVAATFGTAGIVLAALYMLILYQRTMTGPVSPAVEGSHDLSLREKWVIAPVVRDHRRARVLPTADSRCDHPRGQRDVASDR